MRFAILLALLPRLALAATYEVGPGKPYGSIGAVPWESLGAGDTVLIHARPAPYAEKWVVNARGTEAAPVTVRGMPDAGGALPVIEGSGATTRASLNFWNEERGVIKVGGSNVPADGTPAWVVIERLHVRGARPPARFTGRGRETAYGQNAAAIYVEKGEHVTIRECELEGSGNGLFVASASTDVRVQRNHLHGNGNAGSIYEHNSYTEALGITFEGNRYGPLLSDAGGNPLAQGNNLKDRSAGAVIRWNWIEGGNRALDLVDAEGSAALVADPSYAVTRVYGNVLLELDDGLNSQVLHFGGDSGATADYRPELHFWNNTVVSARGGNTTLVRLSSPGQTARLWNNVVHATAGPGRLALAEGGGGIELGGNWLTAGWVASHGATGPIADEAGNQTGAHPGFTDLAGQQLGPAAGSPILGSAATLPPPLAALPLDRQYLRHQGTAPRSDAGRSVGAFASGGGGTAPGPTPAPGPGATSGCGCSGGADCGLLLALLAPLAARGRRLRPAAARERGHARGGSRPRAADRVRSISRTRWVSPGRPRALALLPLLALAGGCAAGRSEPAEAGPGCGEGAVTTPCTCGGATRVTGHCCGNVWQAVACGPPPTTEIVPADRITTWNPGILSDGQLGLPLGADGLPQRTATCATLSPGASIQAAIDACPPGQVVQLGAGTFTVSSTITITKGVVLRGAGSQGAPGGTTIVKTGGASVVAIGSDRDSTCYPGSSGARALAQDAAKESTTLAVGSAASAFAPGDLALVDQVDDALIDQGDCTYFKRAPGRSVTQRVAIAAVDAGSGTLTLGSPLHWTFRAASPYLAQITRVTRPVTRWAGIERLRIQGGTNPSYNGAMAGGIDISNAAFCWVKDVQTDDTIGGMHVSLTGTYRCVVRDGFFHHSASYGFGADCYGIVLRCGASENLVENNIVRWMNKPILFNVTGGGNVVAYNYTDNSWATPPAWQEVNVDCHCSFPHMELVEGNDAPHMGATTTHGNAGYLTFFRNHASSQFAPPAVFGSTATQDGNVTALQLPDADVGMNVLGNVLGSPGWSTVYDGSGSSGRAIYRLGSATGASATTIYRHGNYDAVSGATIWNPANAVRALPASLYRSGKPTWWPDGAPWPWVGPDLVPMVGTLPARARSDAMP